MTSERSIVERDHEVFSIAKELEKITCVVSNKFIAANITANFPPFV
jgi:hypothetical protein